MRCKSESKVGAIFSASAHFIVHTLGNSSPEISSHCLLTPVPMESQVKSCSPQNIRFTAKKGCSILPNSGSRRGLKMNSYTSGIAQVSGSPKIQNGWIEEM